MPPPPSWLWQEWLVSDTGACSPQMAIDKLTGQAVPGAIWYRAPTLRHCVLCIETTTGRGLIRRRRGVEWLTAAQVGDRVGAWRKTIEEAAEDLRRSAP